MSIDELLSVCGVRLPAVFMWFLWGSTLGTRRSRQQSVRMQTEVLALRAGETFVGVIDRNRWQNRLRDHLRWIQVGQMGVRAEPGHGSRGAA